MVNYNVPKKNGQNSLIKINKLPDEKMRELGFTDYVASKWYLCRSLGSSLTFNLSINKRTLKCTFDIMDENFLQPYDYQEILKNDPENELANKVHELVQFKMRELVEANLIAGYVENDYI